MHVSIKNLTLGVRVFKNLRGQDVIVQPQEERSFEMHPHHVRQAKREAEKENPKLGLSGDPDDLVDVDRPGGNMTDEEQAKLMLARQAQEQRLQGLRRQAGLEPPAPPADSFVQEQHSEPQTFQEAADEPVAQTDPANPENPSRAQRRRYRS